jgi:hypothetical protein
MWMLYSEGEHIHVGMQEYCFRSPKGQQMEVAVYDEELKGIMAETADTIAESYYYAAWDSLAALGLIEDDGPVPPVIWKGVAQAVADISGYRVVLEALQLDRAKAEVIEQAVQYKKATIAEPTLFFREAED